MNLPELIERLRDYINNTDDCALRKEAAEALEQLAAALMVKDESLKWLMHNSREASTFHEANQALAIQPHAELVAKIKTDAVALFLAEKHVIYGPLLIVDRIERGEVK